MHPQDLKRLLTKFLLVVLSPSLQFVCVCTPRTFNWKKLFSVERLYLACINIVMENFQWKLKPTLKIAFFLLEGVSMRIFVFSLKGLSKSSTVHSNDKTKGLFESFTRPIIWPRKIFNSSLKNRFVNIFERSTFY